MSLFLPLDICNILYITAKQMDARIDGNLGDMGIGYIPLFKGPSGDAIHMVITLYQIIFFGNNIVEQSIVN